MIEITNQQFIDAISSFSRSFKLSIKNLDNSKSFGVKRAEIYFPFSPNQLTFGAVSSANISCEIVNSTLQKNEIIKPEISVDGIDSVINFGKFRITEINKKDKIHQIVAYDKINFIKGVYKSTGSKKVSAVWSNLCEQCTNLNALGFDTSYVEYNGSFKNNIIDTNALSGYNIREVFSFVASFVGCNVVVNNEGKFEMKEFTTQNNYDLLNINRISTPTLLESNTTIDFLMAKVSNDRTLTSGETTGTGIVFNNPAVTQSQLDSVLNGSPLKSYREGKIKYLLADPRVQAGDLLNLIGVESGNIKIPIMEIKFTFDGGLFCSINSNHPNENQNLTLSEKINFSIKNSTDSKKYAESAIEFSDQITNSLGLYVTKIYDSTGAIKYYMHNKSTLESSDFITTMTSEGFAIANSWNNGNPTFVSGINRDSNAIIKMLTAYKINADQIEAGSITGDKIKAKTIDATRLDVKDLTALNASIADWIVHPTLLYYPSIKQDDGTYNSGVGMSNVTYAFYAGYYSDDNVYNSSANHPGSPWQMGNFDTRKTAFFVKRDGTMFVDNVNVSSKLKFITKYEFSDTTNATIDCDGFYLNIKSTESIIGVKISAFDNNYYEVYKNKEIIRGYEYGNYIQGSLYVYSSLIVENNLNAKFLTMTYKPSGSGSVETTFPIAQILDNGNTAFGSVSQYGDTIIYTKSGGTVAINSSCKVVGNLNLVYSSGSTNYTSRINVNSSGDLVLGYSSQSGNTNIYSKSDGFVKIHNEIRCVEKISVEVGSEWKGALRYSTIGDITGLHVGTSAYEPLVLRGSEIITTNKLTVDGDLSATKITASSDLSTNAYFYMYKKSTSGTTTYKSRLQVSTSGNLVIGYDGQSGDTNIYAKTNGNIRIYNHLRVSPNVSINFYVDSAWKMGVFYGTPDTDMTGFHLGIAGYNTYLWGTVKLSSGSAVTSDCNLKKDIDCFTDEYEVLFNNLKPKTYKYIDGTSGRTHTGFIAQDVKEALDVANLKTEDFAAYVSFPLESGGETLALRYEEFIALNTHMIQKCLSKISSLEDEIKSLKETINNG